MENSGEDGDDQGWLEVKKRHRSSSKLSVQSNIGGFPNKTHSSFGRSQSSSEVKIINGSLSKKSLPRKRGRAFSNHEKMGIKSLSSSSKEDNSVICLEKQGINQENKLSKLHVSDSIKVADSEEGTRSGQEVLNKVDLDKTPKIKWGDLEDEVLEISIVANNSMSNVSHNNVHPEQKLVINSDEEEKCLGVILSSAVQEELLNENCKEVNEISSEPVELSIADEKMESLNDVGGTLFTTCNKSLELSCKEANDVPCSSDPLGDACFSSGTLDISELPSTSQVTTTEVGAVESMRFPHEKGSTEASGDDFVAYAVENGSVQENLGDVNLSKRQLVTALEEGESGESKERFRERLWCFLFENLNRAVDELYLLCELECDVEQMKEAILVLEEAGSDFKELESRVEGFDKLKRSSSKLSQDGAPANVNTDYRRPHALSWEVRRMTTSPHRAEILSSSLEAFKKVQQEMASKLPVQDPKGLMRTSQHAPTDLPRKSPGKNGAVTNARELGVRSRKQTGVMDLSLGPSSGEKRTADKLNKGNLVQSNRLSPQNLSDFSSLPHLKEGSSMNKEKVLSETKVEKIAKYSDSFKRSGSLTDKEKEKEKRNAPSWKSMNAWKEKRNWEDILASPLRTSSRVSHSMGMSRKSAERARVLHDKLMSPEKKKKTALDMKREAEEKHARAMRIRSELENERVQRLQRTSEKLNRVSEWQNMRSLKLREGMYARHQRSESRHEAHLAQVVRRAGDESSKVNEVRFITSLNEENKKIMLRQKLHDSELRRAEKLQVIKTKQKEDCAREEAVLERRKLLEAEKLQRLAETQRKKEEAQVRREEERKASSAAREARAMEQLRRKEVRAKAQQEEAELLAQKLAERLSESETRRKFYLEQIRDRASMDFRDQSSPSIRRSSNKDGPGKLVLTNSVEDFQTNCSLGGGTSVVGIVDAVVQQSLKRRIKKIRQKLMAMKYEFAEPPVGADIAGIGYRTQVGVARAKIGRWLQDLQRLRQARKEGAASLGLIVCDMIKFLEGKDLELHVSRQVGLLDFIASALPASHTPKPENCQVTMSLLRLLRVLLSVPANRSYFIAQNLLPPIIPMLSAALENYIKIAASSNLPLNTANLVSGKTSLENMESIAEVMEGFLWTVATTIGHICSHEGQIQMQNGLTELVVAYQVVHRLRDLFALFDRPQLEGSPFPSFILLSLNLLAVLTSWSGNVSYIDWGFYLPHSTSASNNQEAKPAEAAKLVDELCGTKHDEPLSDLKGPENLPSKMSIGVDKSEETADESQRSRIEEHVEVSFSQRDDNSKTYNTCAEQNINVQRTGDTAANKKTENGHGVCLKQPIAFLVSAVVETGLVSLPSLLTAVLLQANSKMSSEQGSYVLPSNFEEVATGVLKVLNNLALLDINLLQRMLARPDLKMEFFHLMSFLLSHCTSKWKAATDQVGFLLLETLLLLGYFALFHPGNQAVLRWGKSPTILHKVCDLPFVFFSDPELTPILAGTLVAACYGCEQNKGVVQQELSMEMLLSLLKSCRQGLVLTQSEPSPPENNTTNDDSCDGYQSLLEPRKLQNDISVRSTRNYPRSSRASLGKGVFFGSNARVSKTKNQRDSKATKTCDEWALTHNLPASEVSSTFMLHSRFPSSFIDRAEEFFSIESV